MDDGDDKEGQKNLILLDEAFGLEEWLEEPRAAQAFLVDQAEAPL